MHIDTGGPTSSRLRRRRRSDLDLEALEGLDGVGVLGIGGGLGVASEEGSDSGE